MVSRIKLLLGVAGLLLLAACSNPAADIAGEACDELGGEEFLAANSGLVAFIDRLREAEPDSSVPEGDDAVKELATIRETEFWAELADQCPALTETLEAGPSRAELEAIVQGVTDAQRAIEDFQFQVEGGLTYGGVLDEWPAVSASAVRGVRDFQDSIDSLPSGLPSDDLTDLLAFSLAVANMHDEWAAVHDAVGTYIRDDGSESAISSAYSEAIDASDKAADERDKALTPGSG